MAEKPTPIRSRIPRTGAARAPRKEAAPKPRRPPDPIQLEKARLVREQADRAERINARERAELLPADMVEREWSHICASIRASLLAVPARVAQAHPGHAAIVATVETEIRAALAELAEDSL
ncbi:terminase small subunit [Roseomonas rosulenta]|uniref:terminase small subunit n=1 Tax=Roseomonas rosulenta TaxID=2748667 RepID=UPI0018E054CD